MKWNTIPLTNIDDEVFIGRYNGIDFPIEVDETVYLPSMIAQHLYTQLVLRLDKKIDKNDAIPEYIKILGKEIMTSNVEDKNMSFNDQVKLHQKQFEQWQEEEKKKAITQKDKAINIAKKNV